MFSTSMSEFFTGAFAEAATTASPFFSKAFNFSAASGASRSTSFRLNARTETDCFFSKETILLPTKPAAPITTTRAGFSGFAVRCSSIWDERRLAQRMNAQPRGIRLARVHDTVRIDDDFAAHRRGHAGGLDVPVL